MNVTNADTGKRLGTLYFTFSPEIHYRLECSNGKEFNADTISKDLEQGFDDEVHVIFDELPF